MRPLAALVFALALPGTALPAQQRSADAATAPATRITAATYAERYTELMAIAAVPGRVAEVKGLVLQRDVARFTLETGHLYLLSAVGGRTVAAVFRGRGQFRFTPPVGAEQGRLARFFDRDTLDTPFTELALIFTDSTLRELESRLVFGEGRDLGAARSAARKMLGYLGDADADEKTFDVDLMSALLNGESNGLFYAHVERVQGSPVMFMLNPDMVEGVRLSTRARGVSLTGRRPELVSQFPRLEDSLAAGATTERRRFAGIRHYEIDARLPRTGSGGLGFSAAARVEITADAPVGPWVAFQLYAKLDVDSARWESGEPVTMYRGDDDWALWLHLGTPLQPGEVRTLRLYYGGDLIERFGDWYFIESSISWYPGSLEGRNLATFDVTYHSPTSYLLASVGDRVDSSAVDRTMTTRWVTTTPIRNASFNLGIFEEYRVEEEGVPPVTVLVSEKAHRTMKQFAARDRNMKEQVGDDVTKSLRFFQHVYGEPPAPRFFATEIPYGHGEAFPGLVHLSWSTFHQTSRQGYDEVFRAHEVAHQWWGIGVDYATYRDRWLSEGFSNFSGLWYLQTVRQQNDKYFDFLHDWRTDILARHEQAGPISLGHRTMTARDGWADYNVIVYQKGAWVVHMLRMMMLDLKTMNEDRFTGMMRDFYGTYRGRRASTDDFRQVVERHMGMDMRWFFDQWVHASAIPTYRVAWRAAHEGNGQHRIRLRVDQENVPAGFRMYVPVAVDLGDGRVMRLRVKVQGPRTEVELPLVPVKPKDVRFNELDGVLAEVDETRWES